MRVLFLVVVVVSVRQITGVVYCKYLFIYKSVVLKRTVLEMCVDQGEDEGFQVLNQIVINFQALGISRSSDIETGVEFCAIETDVMTTANNL